MANMRGRRTGRGYTSQPVRCRIGAFAGSGLLSGDNLRHMRLLPRYVAQKSGVDAVPMGRDDAARGEVGPVPIQRTSAGALDGSAFGDGDARLGLLEMTVTAAGIGTFDWDLVSGTLAWDRRLIDLFGYEPDTFDRTIESFLARVHPEDVPRVAAALETASRTCGEFAAEYRIILPGGHIRWIRARGRVLGDENGSAFRFLGAAWDTSNSAQAEAAIARGIESMATAFFSLDTAWRFTYANAEAERVLGRSREELLGGVLWDLFPAAVGSDVETNYRATMMTGEPSTFDAYYPPPLDAWFEVRAGRNADGLAVYFLDVTARHVSQAVSDRAAKRAQVLDRLTEALVGTLDSDQAAQHLSQLIVPGLADWCAVTLVDDASQTGTRHGLRNVAVAHVNPAMVSSVDRYAQAALQALNDDSLVVRAIETGAAQFLHNDATEIALAVLDEGPIRDLIALLAPEAIAILPLTGRTGPIGIVTLATGKSRGPFTAEDLVTVHHIAARAGLVLDNARLYRQQRELAEHLQRSLLTPPPEPDHLQIVVRYVPAAAAAQVGGDWYDAFMQHGGATMVVIGDVVGHDAEATATMGQIRSLVRGFGALGNDGPADVLRKTDQVMETLLLTSTATAVIARLEQSTAELRNGETTLRWSNAGHPPPMTLAPNGTVEILAVEDADIILGVSPNAARQEYQRTLDRDCVVLLYTDGLVERRGVSIDDGLTALQRHLQALHNCDLDSLCDQLLERMLPDGAEDDVALVAVKLHRQDRPRPPKAGPNRVPPNVPPPTPVEAPRDAV
jgi:serine phosphatase RsbU (regulator of sigma subunit)/PAS domain-containing protein